MLKTIAMHVVRPQAIIQILAPESSTPEHLLMTHGLSNFIADHLLLGARLRNEFETDILPLVPLTNSRLVSTAAGTAWPTVISNKRVST